MSDKTISASESVKRIAREIHGGIYELTEAVANPKPDRRVKYDWRCEAMWSKGTRFLVTVVRQEGLLKAALDEGVDPLKLEKMERKVEQIEVTKVGHPFRHQNVAGTRDDLDSFEADDRNKLILAALLAHFVGFDKARSVEDLVDLHCTKRRPSNQTWNTLLWLEDQGIIDREQLVEALEAINSDKIYPYEEE